MGRKMQRAAPRRRVFLAILFNLFLNVYAGAVDALNVNGNGSNPQILDPEELKTLSTPPPPHLYDDWKDWEDWKPSPELVKSFPYYRSGYDENGLVVYVVDFGKWNYRDLALEPEAKIKEFWRYFEQYVRRVQRDGALKGHQGTVFILDWDGFQLEEYASASALQLALKMFTGLVRVNEVLSYSFYINVNFSAETFLNLARPFMSELLEKVDIYGTCSSKWKPMLLRKIPASQLRPEYGGDEGWKALPLDPSGR